MSRKYELLNPNLSFPIFMRTKAPISRLIANIINRVLTYPESVLQKVNAVYIPDEQRINCFLRFIWNSMYFRILGIGIPLMAIASIFLDSSQSRLKKDWVKYLSMYTATTRGIAKGNSSAIPSERRLENCILIQNKENQVTAKVSQ